METETNMDAQKQPEKKSKKTFDGDFIGYIEGDISTGKLIITDVCGTLAAELALKITNNFYSQAIKNTRANHETSYRMYRLFSMH